MSLYIHSKKFLQIGVPLKTGSGLSPFMMNTQLILEIDDEKVFNLYQKLGKEKMRNLASDFLKTYANLCLSNDAILQTAIIESEKSICSKLLSRRDIEDIITAKLSYLPSREELTHIVNSNTATLDAIRSNIILELKKTIAEDNNISMLKHTVLTEFQRLSINSPNRDDLNKLRDSLLRDMTQIENSKSVGITELDSFRLKLLQDMSLITIKSNIDVKPMEQSMTEIKSSIQDMSLFFSKSSQVKGEAAETLFERQLHSIFPTIEIVKSVNKAQSGDFILKFESKTYIIDVKNYSTNVPKKEIDKLRRDIVEQKANGGILVSISSGIVGVDKIGFNNQDNIPIILLANNKFDMDMISFAVNFMKSNSNNMPQNNADKDILDKMVVKIKKILGDFDHSIELIKRTRQNVLNALNNDQPIIDIANKYACAECNQVFKNQSGLTSHNKHRHIA